MLGYGQISWVASGLLTDVATLLDFDRRGWIKTVEKHGSVFIAAEQRYRARYILHLRQKKGLSDEQIAFVLSVQRPPYSVADLDRILRERTPAPSASKSRHSGEGQQSNDEPCIT